MGNEAKGDPLETSRMLTGPNRSRGLKPSKLYRHHHHHLSRRHPKQITRKSEISRAPPCSIHTNTANSNTQYMTYCQKVLAEQWIRSVWSVTPALFWETAELLWSRESGYVAIDVDVVVVVDDNNNNNNVKCKIITHNSIIIAKDRSL